MHRFRLEAIRQDYMQKQHARTHPRMHTTLVFAAAGGVFRSGYALQVLSPFDSRAERGHIGTLMQSTPGSVSDYVDGVLATMLEHGRQELTNAMEFQKLYYGIWSLAAPRLYAANGALQTVMESIDKGRGSVPLRAHAFALIGMRSVLFPDGVVANTQAMSILNRALELDPGAQLARLLLASEFCKVALSKRVEHFHRKGAFQFQSHAAEELAPLLEAGEPVAWLMQAALHLLTGNPEEAGTAARTALRLAPRDAAIMDKAGQMLQRGGYTQESDAIFEAGIEAGYWPTKDQRPHIYWTRLPVLPAILPTGIYPELDSIRAAVQGLLPQIRRDVERFWKTLVLETLSNDFQKSQLLDPWTDYSGVWYEKKVYVCSFGGQAPCDRKAMPALCDGLARLEGRRKEDLHVPLNCSTDLRTNVFPADGTARVLQATLSVVAPPRTAIDWHSSSEHGRLRLQCPLYTPPGSESRLFFRGNESIVYQQGACFWFDESKEHKLEYTGADYRVSLLIDFFHPALRQQPGIEQDVILRLEPLSKQYFTARLKKGV
eukprot:TRINITY_DN123494_c0_g1_i1.p1 TRINITY_DN123494_c0_g1~~TRINITY_DN123494_c0_g1_i1.p1  ORF type:complete len:546 (+),score=56.48 TRINITY_DN123494_c0_g1_i1:114-1751(+)